ncbi:PepSY domain-containing protein [Mesorhizobium sp. BE184]|uniref:PepSY domain-containing protein n=1 Tax=Mesorhizobium sp. BE184 TaxID=2817714 RepID=UPI00286C95FB|nr:PepSY domain-containing protein [Mesorhizobium sp. BE184]
MLKTISAAAFALVLAASPALAQSAAPAPDVPPANGKKLSEIIAKVEKRPDFRYISEVSWDDGGYDVTYYTTDNAKVEMKFDAVSGETRSLD